MEKEGWEEGGEEAAGELEKKEEETWVEWITRATHISTTAMRRANVADWVDEQRKRKWRWAGHVARRDDGRWTVRVMNWEPVSGKRSVGRPETRWEDSLVRFAKGRGRNWRELAKNRDDWSGLEEQFVQQGT